MAKNNGSMFGRNGDGAGRGDGDGRKPGVRTVLGAGCRVEGKLICAGPSRVDGVVIGELEADEFLLIDKNSTVNADIKVRELEVRGKVKGDIRVSKRVSLCENADVEGDIVTPSIAISDGAQFKGRVEVSLEEQTTAAFESAMNGERPHADQTGAVIREFTRPAGEAEQNSAAP